MGEWKATFEEILAMRARSDEKKTQKSTSWQ